MIQLIVATDRKGCIGKGGTLPFRLRHDLQNFKNVTQDTVCIMGRKTFASLPAPLSNRTMVVCTKSVKGLECNLNDSDIWYTNSPEYWVKSWKKNRDISIIGGTQIYTLFAPIVDRIIWTQVDCEIESGDAFYMPNVEGFELVETNQFSKSPHDQYGYMINTYTKTK